MKRSRPAKFKILSGIGLFFALTTIVFSFQNCAPTQFAQIAPSTDASLASIAPASVISSCALTDDATYPTSPVISGGCYGHPSFATSQFPITNSSAENETFFVSTTALAGVSGASVCIQEWVATNEQGPYYQLPSADGTDCFNHSNLANIIANIPQGATTTQIFRAPLASPYGSEYFDSPQYDTYRLTGFPLSTNGGTGPLPPSYVTLNGTTYPAPIPVWFRLSVSLISNTNQILCTTPQLEMCFY